MELNNLHNLKRIHEGRFSIVFIANSGDDVFVVKQLHPRYISDAEQVERFHNEATLFNQLNPDQCSLVQNKHGHFIIRKYISGVTLKEIARKLPFKRNVRIYVSLFKLAAKQIGLLHDAGFIHGDIKPSNILIDKFDLEPEVHLLDYGLSFNTLNRPIKKLSSPLPFSMVYASPELMLNEPELINEKSDLFSFGITMLESMTGKPLYQSSHPAILMQMMLAVPIKIPKEIPEPLNEIIRIITLKPSFQKPVAHYSVQEVRLILEENQLQRNSIPNVKELLNRLA